MPLRYYANAPATALTNSCTALATSIVVDSVAGLPITYPYTLIIDRGTASEEAIEVTAAAGTTLTVTRGIDGTTAFAHAADAEVVHGITARDVREPNTHVNTSSGVHGVTGDLVGTTDTQTLTGKTISADSNTINGFAASSFVVTDGTGKADGAAAQKAIPTGAVVGTTDTQTLTNKTLTAPAATGSLASFGGAWTSFSPTLSGFTVSSSDAYHSRTGKQVTISYRAVIATVSGAMKFTLPVNAVRLPASTQVLGVAFGGDVSANAYNIGAAYLDSTSLIGFVSSGGVWNASIPWAWAAGDTLSFTITYESV